MRGQQEREGVQTGSKDNGQCFLYPCNRDARLSGALLDGQRYSAGGRKATRGREGY